MPVVSLPGYQPVARFDGVPWTQAQIKEASEPTGSFSLIDTITLSPVDTDPTQPQARDFTTTHAVLTSGFYQVIFLDAGGNTQPMEVRQYPPPAPDTLRQLVTLDQLKRALNVTRTTSDSDLEQTIRATTAIIERLTGKRFTPTPAQPTDAPVTISVSVDGPTAPIRSFLFGPAAFGAPLGPQPTWAEWPVTIPHASEIDSVSLDTVGVLTSSQYQLETDSTLRDPYTRRVVILDPSTLPAQTLSVTGRFGIVPPPDDLCDAALAMCARRYKERDASWGDTVQLPEGGLVSYYRSLPPSVRLAIDSYCEVSM